MDRKALLRAGVALGAMTRSLPTGAVELLAREVISRLAGRAVDDTGKDADKALVDALLGPGELTAMRRVARMIGQGVPVAEIYLVHLTGSARRLGQMWEDDSLSSAQVTLAAARIYTIMRGLSPELPCPDGLAERHAVFAPVPGSKHVLGARMAADLFRRDGWHIDLRFCDTGEELLSDLAQMDFRVLGLSAAARADILGLTRVIAALRVTAPHVRVLIAGNLARLEPDLRLICDADAVATDFDTAHAEILRMSGHGALHSA